MSDFNFANNSSSYPYYYDDHHHLYNNGEERFLGPATTTTGVEKEVVLDYTVLNVVIVTLVLILVIEVMRHRLDVWASGSPFFKTVLELMYRELTTLGIVECVIYLLHKYWEQFNIAYEVVFIDIHFMLFYTAVINAIQSSLVRVLTTRLTNKQWTMTEDIDIYHYVAIRKEFDRLEQQFQLDSSIPTSVGPDSTDQGFFPTNQNYLRNTLRDIAFRIRHPYKSSRKKALIVPVRFHELRAHFIESNNLPQKFKVSPYLNLSLTSVLLEFVHISPTAWILLMASANVLYFLSGAILDATRYVGSITTFLLVVFFTVMIMSVILQFLITLKMKSIFSHIINTKTWTTTVRSGDAVDVSVDEKRSREQLNLFWGGTPHYIIVATQYMQFGYAIGLAFIFTYHKDLSKRDWVATLLLVWIASFSVFLFLVNRMMPWYTLCTSMGQLVNKERLHQTLAKLKLKEEERKKEVIIEELKAEEEIARRRKKLEETKREENITRRHTSPPKASRFIRNSLINLGLPVGKPSAEGDEGKRKHGRKKSFSDGVQTLRDVVVEDLERSFPKTNSPPRMSDAAAKKLVPEDEGQLLQDHTVAENARGMPPPQQTLAKTRKERRRLRKTQSENVGAMRAMNDLDMFLLNDATTGIMSTPKRARENNRTRSAASVSLSPIISPIRTEAEEKREELEKEIERIEWSFKDNSKLSPERLALKEEIDKLRTELEKVELRIKLEEKTEDTKDSNIHDETDSAAHTLPKTQNMGNFHENNTGELQADLPSSLLPPITPRDDPSGRRSSCEEVDVTLLSGATDSSDILDRKQRRSRRRQSRSEGVAFMRSSLAAGNSFRMSSQSSSLAPVCELGRDAKLETLTSLTKVSTKDLPEIPPYRKESFRFSPVSLSSSTSRNDPSMPRDNLSHRDDSTVIESKETTDSSGILDRKQEGRRRRRQVRSEGVAFMRSSLADSNNPTLTSQSSSLAPVCELGGDAQLETLAGLTKMSTKDLPEIPPYKGKSRRTSLSRMRSGSDGVSLMRMGLSRDADSVKSVVVTEDENKTKPSSMKAKALSVSTNEERPNNRVSFSLFNSSPAAKALASPTDHTSSIDSAASVDGDSDIDDVPDVLPDDSSAPPSKHIFAMPRRFDLTSFLQGPKYRAASFLYGPMVCLYLIGRVETFNIRSGTLYDQQNTLHFRLHDSFWAEFAWYCIMILEMCVVFLYFTRKSCRNKGNGYQSMHSITAAGWGFLINVTCLLLLIIAESQRCCYPDPTDGKQYEELIRALGPSRVTDATTDQTDLYNPLLTPETCNCPDFGRRLYGGLGKIEPFTCLIMLSPFRFIFAMYTLRLFGYRGNKDDQGMHLSTLHHGSHDFDIIATKARELWLSTIGAHSDVAARFGVFSAECLLCMLGIYSPDLHEGEVNETTSTVGKHAASDPSIESSVQNPAELEATREGDQDITVGTPKTPHKRGTPFDFETFGVVFDDFSYPSSRLIRRMRRCERRLLPFLDEWQVVDAVLTSHELVLFDVREESEEDFSSAPDMTNNGGKGVRLCDVAKGRKILSQFDLNDVDFVDIEHRLATVSDSNHVEDVEIGFELLLEFWQGGNDHIGDYSLRKINDRWSDVNEDRLKVHFKSGGGTTLFLRFAIDLKEMESRKINSHVENDNSDQLSEIGKQAKVWCRTIARLRGAMNLPLQRLPHFNDDNEMEDFIEYCPREEENNKGLKALLRRNTSFGVEPDSNEERNLTLTKVRKSFHY